MKDDLEPRLPLKPDSGLEPTLAADRSTASGASAELSRSALPAVSVETSMEGEASTAGLGREAAINREEARSAQLRMRMALSVGVALWCVFAGLDWIVGTYIRPDLFGYLMMLRFAPVPLFGLVLLKLYASPRLSRRTIDLLDLATYTVASTGISLMCVGYGGLSSWYSPGISLVILARSVTSAEHWRKGLYMGGIPALAFPTTLGVASLVSPTIGGQLRDPAAVAHFIQSLFFIGSTFLFILIGGHIVWMLRRQVFESRTIGRYKLKRRLAVGGMGEVWAAYDTTLRRDVALKILRPDLSDARAVARFEREVHATTMLSHPNTVRVFDYGVTADGLWYYAMELLEGEDLRSVVAREGSLQPARVRHLGYQAARALSEAHGRGIVHRDIKPDNLFLTTLGGERDFLKLVDFGIARIAEGETRATVTLAGTPAYMAPEMIRSGEATEASDVYGLGGVLYFLLTSKAPFEADSAAAVMQKHVGEQPVTPSLRSGVTIPAALEAIVMRCLEKDPAARFSTALEVAAALATCADLPAWMPAIAPSPEDRTTTSVAEGAP
jgi:serine/threonine-protein kinase